MAKKAKQSSLPGCLAVLAVVAFLAWLTGKAPKGTQPGHAPRARADQGGPSTPARRPSTPKWYVGGTLHRSTLGEWYAATPANRLATCADFVVGLRTKAGERVIVDSVRTRREATRLMECINESGRDRRTDGVKVAEVAAACEVLRRAGQ